MKIYVDADACPVVKIIEQIAKMYSLEVELLCDVNHELNSDYSSITIIDQGADAVDYALINLCKEGDIVVTQDYGVATLTLGKKAYPIHPSGREYTNDNINELLTQRAIGMMNRRSSRRSHIKGPKKRKKEDDINFYQSFEKLVVYALSVENNERPHVI